MPWRVEEERRIEEQTEVSFIFFLLLFISLDKRDMLGCVFLLPCKDTNRRKEKRRRGTKNGNRSVWLPHCSFSYLLLLSIDLFPFLLLVVMMIC